MEYWVFNEGEYTSKLVNGVLHYSFATTAAHPNFEVHSL